MIFIQEIVSAWTKRSRGAPGAAQRNVVPEGLPLALVGEPDSNFVRQAIRFREGDGFQEHRHPLEEQAWYGDELWLGPVSLTLTGGLPTVWFDDTIWEWAPSRCVVPRLAFELPVGAWGRVRYNGRRPGEDIWMYAKHVVNIAHGVLLDDGVFLGSPDFGADLMVQLR